MTVLSKVLTGATRLMGINKQSIEQYSNALTPLIKDSGEFLFYYAI